MPSAPKAPTGSPEHFTISTDSEDDVHMMPKAAASAAVPREAQWPSIAPRALAVPKEAQWPPTDPRSLERDRRRVERRQHRRGTPTERQEVAPHDDEIGRLRRFDENAANHPRRILGNFPSINESGPSGSSGSRTITTYDVRRPPSGPSSSSGHLPAPQRLRSRSPDHRRNERNVRPRGENPRDDPSDSSQEAQVKLPRTSNQVDYAGRILAGKANLGDTAEKIMDTIRRDLNTFSNQKENRYLAEFYGSRKVIMLPTMDMAGYSHRLVLENALLEFSLESWRRIPLTSVHITEFSVAVLRLISEADTLFCWTTELFRRLTSRRREDQLKEENRTYQHLLNYNRFLVYWLRHRRLSHPTTSSFQLLENLGRAGNNQFTQSYLFNSPAVLAILVACMRKDRFGITVGIRDQCAWIFRTTIMVSCTHGGSLQCEDDEDLPEISWSPNFSESLLAVHGTTLENWGLIVQDQAMKSMDRTDLHFTIFRADMMIKEMPQLKNKGIFLFIDPAGLHHCEGFLVTININDVVKVQVGPGGMNIKYLLTAINGVGEYADLEWPYYKVPTAPASEPLLLNFIHQLHNPATELFDDRYGTTGPRAMERVQRAETLAEGYQKMAATLSLADASEHVPQIMDRQGDNAPFRDFNTNPRMEALVPRQQAAEPMVQNLVDLYKSVEDIPRSNQQPTTVGHQLSLRNSPAPGIEPHDGADFDNHDSDCESYEGDVADIAERQAFTPERLKEFDDCYLQIAKELSQRYEGVTQLEAQVVVQAYCILRKLPVGERPSRAAYSLAFDSIFAKQACGDYSPPNPVETIRKSNNKTDLRHMYMTEYDQSEIFDELVDRKPYWDKIQWVKDPMFGKLRSQVMGLPASAGYLQKWFTADEICNATDELQSGFHDPSGHHHYLKKSHILPQDVWIPTELVPTPDEIQAARFELSHSSEGAMNRAVMLLSSNFIPHDQHEYTLMVKCSLCASIDAPQCLVCETALCNRCRNTTYPYQGY